MNIIRAAKLQSDAILPSRKHKDDAGIDFYSVETKIIGPNKFDVIRTGITIEIPQGYMGLMMPKSRNDHLLGAGVIDAGYQGEILIKIANISNDPLKIEYGQAIGQMILVPIVTPDIVDVGKENIHTKTSERGATGGILGN